MHNLGHSRSNGCFQSGRIHRCMTITDIHRGSTETNSTDAKDVQQVTQCSSEGPWIISTEASSVVVDQVHAS